MFMYRYLIAVPSLVLCQPFLRGFSAFGDPRFCAIPHFFHSSYSLFSLFQVRCYINSVCWVFIHGITVFSSPLYTLVILFFPDSSLLLTPLSLKLKEFTPPIPLQTSRRWFTAFSCLYISKNVVKSGWKFSQLPRSRVPTPFLRTMYLVFPPS